MKRIITFLIVVILAASNVPSLFPQTQTAGFVPVARAAENFILTPQTAESFMPVAQIGGILYAKPGGLTGGNCDTWANGCELRYALNTVATSDDEIWVAAGTYKPTGGSDRAATFQLQSGVALYGGFAGTETSRDQRDWEANLTILSGDIGAVGNIYDNSYHVVTGSGTDATAILDGFTITGGQASDSFGPEHSGGGMLIESGSPTLTNLTFSDNSASFSGGGMDVGSGSPTLANVTFSGNYASGYYPLYSGQGGGMQNWGGSPTLTDVTFTGNGADAGGGMYNSGGSPTLTDVTFSDNHADYGGGMHNSGGSPTLTNVTFKGNSTFITCQFGNATGDGGGMYNENSSPTLTGVMFSGNSANNGGGIYNSNSSPEVTNVTFSDNAAIEKDCDGIQGGLGGGMYNSGGSPIVANTILWNNTRRIGPQIYGGSSTISYSLVQGSGGSGAGWDSGLGTDGGGNLDADPLFVDPPNNLHLQSGSPAINAGNNSALPLDTFDLDGDGNTTELLSLDLAGNSRINLGTVDMGAYELYPQPPSPIYVDQNATSAKNGASWENALTDLRSALAWAAVGVNEYSMEEVEIWVAAGTYKATGGTSRAATFHLISDVALYGGFAGTETSRDQRDWDTNLTILSGDIGAGGNNSDNSYHVVTGSGTDATAIFDGFTISGGWANDDSQNATKGGGMLNESGSPTLANLIFSGNLATYYGSGMSNSNSSPSLVNVTFDGNYFSNEGGGGCPMTVAARP